MASPSSVTMAELFIKILFLVLGCHSARLPATLVDAAHDHREVCKRVDDDRLRYGSALNLFKCMIPKPAPKPLSFDSALVPWDTNYIALPYSNLAATEDGLHVNISIISSDRAFSRFESKNLFLFGYFSMNMKLVPNESAGVVASFYLSSRDSDMHDEIDFEFLGNTSGNPVTLHTNLYLNGVGGREQNHYLPFDPAAAFHKYSVLWNQHLVIWFADDKVIRVFHNKSNEIAVPFPTSRPMQVISSIWTPYNLTRDWITQGGQVHINYSYAPFVAQYEGFGGVDGCLACPATPATACDKADISACSDANKYWFNVQKELTKKQLKELQEHRRKHVIYDYCNSLEGTLEECQYNC